MEDKLKTSRRSFIWRFFTIRDRNSSACRFCGVALSTRGGSTSNLRRHIYAKHSNIQLKRRKNPPKKQFLVEKPSKMEEDEVIVLDQFVGENVTEDLVIAESKVEKTATPKRSSIWIYFNEIAKERGKCALCGATISIRGGSISNLRRHIRAKHRKIRLDKKKVQTKPARNRNVKTKLNGEQIIENYTGEKFHSEVVFHDYTNTLQDVEHIVEDVKGIVESEEMVELQDDSPKPIFALKGNNERDRSTLREMITLPGEIFSKNNPSNNNESTRITDHGNYEYNDDNYKKSKIDALMKISENMGRLATSFEKIAEFLCAEKFKDSNTGAKVGKLIKNTLIDEQNL